MRVAVLHHWFVTRGGGERVAECIAALFPRAEIFTLLATPQGLPATLASRRLHTSFLQRLPLARSRHRHLLPLYPAATESLDLRGFDLVLSSDAGPIKGVRLDPGAVHVCYCHSPMRYLWDGYETYRASMSGPTRLAFALTVPRVRRWDAAASRGVTHFLANSHYVADRIRRCYGRTAQVLPPPIDQHRVPETAPEPSGAYLCAGRLVAYKRTELLLAACRRLRRPLRLAGSGPELDRLRRLAQQDPLVQFLGELPTAELWQEFAACRALLFAADEDFGMIPLEVQACGRPVIAYGAGGSLETLCLDPATPTGVTFTPQTAAAAEEAILRFERALEPVFRPRDARAWAAGFATPLFLERFQAFVLRHVPAAAAETIPVAEAAAIVTA